MKDTVNAFRAVMFGVCWLWAIAIYALAMLNMASEPVAMRTIGLMAVTMIGLKQ